MYMSSVYVAEVVSIFLRECSTQCCGAFSRENIFKTTRSFRYQWFCVSTHQANANKPFIFSNVKRATGGGHLENAFSPGILANKDVAMLQFVKKDHTELH